MNTLSDFFQPLNIINLLFFLGALVFFDVLGSSVKEFLVGDEKIKSETRLVDWLIGLGFFVFVWFMAGFVLVPSQKNLLISIAILFFVTVPAYLKDKRYVSLYQSFKPQMLPIILILPFLPVVFVKASLPPYAWDEMAYHFISPYTLINSINSYWIYNGGVYQNVPRLIDTLYVLVFSLTHTYSVVRLLQFTILFTALASVFIFVKKLLGFLPAFLFLLIFLSLPIQLPTNSTVGYVDMPALAFLFLGVIFGICFLFSKAKGYMILSLLFWTMSMGTKYTTLITFSSFAVIFGVIYLIKNKSFKSIFNKAIFFKTGIILVVFGGYWYVKNLIIYGNPIYPFFFPCWGKYAADCSAGYSFFGNWTLPVTLQNLYTIVRQLLPQNIILHAILIVSPMSVLLFGDIKAKIFFWLLVLSFGLELLYLKFFSGFLFRYEQHLEFYLILLSVLFCVINFKNKILKTLKLMIISILITSCGLLYFFNLAEMYTSEHLPAEEVRFALSRINIYDWVKIRFPSVSGVGIWCGNSGGGPVALARFDPDTIWFDANGLIRAYFVGCYYKNPDLIPSDWAKLPVVAKEKKLKFWTFTTNPCIPEERVKNKDETADSSMDAKSLADMLQLRRLNNAIVCRSEVVVPNLYYFDYEKLK